MLIPDQLFSMRQLQNTVVAAAGAVIMAAAAPAAAANLSDYAAVYVAPVQIDLQDQYAGSTTNIAFRQNPNVRPEVTPIGQKRNANQLRVTLMEVLGKSRKIVGAPGPGVLTVEATLTSLRASQYSAVEMGTRRVFGPTNSGGGAAATVRFSENGTPLDGEWSGRRYKLDRGSVLSKWEDADRAYYSIARGIDRHISRS